MGGDFAPQATVEGAYLYQKESNAKNEIVLVGDKDLITEECKKYSHLLEMNISIIHASEVVSMDDKPVEALKARPDCSILRALNLVAQGEADAAIVIVGGYFGVAVLVYESVSRVEPHCDGRFSENTPASAISDHTSASNPARMPRGRCD